MHIVGKRILDLLAEEVHPCLIVRGEIIMISRVTASTFSDSDFKENCLAQCKS